MLKTSHMATELDSSPSQGSSKQVPDGPRGHMGRPSGEGAQVGGPAGPWGGRVDPFAWKVNDFFFHRRSVDMDPTVDQGSRRVMQPQLHKDNSLMKFLSGSSPRKEETKNKLKTSPKHNFKKSKKQAKIMSKIMPEFCLRRSPKSAARGTKRGLSWALN